MFDNVGEKIKKIAKGFFVVEALAALIFGFMMAVNGDALAGILIIFGGIFVAWISACLLYGFGEIVTAAIAIAYNSYESAKALKGENGILPNLNSKGE